MCSTVLLHLVILEILVCGLSIHNLSCFISEIEAGRLRLKENHKYYHQVQGQLYLTNTLCCDFIVWTLKDFQVVRIVRSDQWKDNIGKLIALYFDVFVPSL